MRLYKKLSQSKEAMFLIKEFKPTKVSAEEKEKSKIELIDICNSIPVLAIFLLLRGGLLLPLLIKLIPDILPSVFRDYNQITR